MGGIEGGPPLIGGPELGGPLGGPLELELGGPREDPGGPLLTEPGGPREEPLGGPLEGGPDFELGGPDEGPLGWPLGGPLGPLFFTRLFRAMSLVWPVCLSILLSKTVKITNQGNWQEIYRPPMRPFVTPPKHQNPQHASPIVSLPNLLVLCM